VRCSMFSQNRLLTVSPREPFATAAPEPAKGASGGRPSEPNFTPVWCQCDPVSDASEIGPDSEYADAGKPPWADTRVWTERKDTHCRRPMGPLEPTPHHPESGRRSMRQCV